MFTSLGAWLAAFGPARLKTARSYAHQLGTAIAVKNNIEQILTASDAARRHSPHFQTEALCRRAPMTPVFFNMMIVLCIDLTAVILLLQWSMLDKMHNLKKRTGLLKNDQYSFVVSNEQSGQRLDLFLSRVIPDFSRSHFKKLIKEDLVLVNGVPAKPSQETRSGDLIVAKVPGPAPAEALEPQPMRLDILFEDEDLLIVNKAPGLVVHPGAGHDRGTLVHGLLAHSPRLPVQGSPLRPGIVHRLDKDTSGALVIAKSERAYLNLARQFKERRVGKEYLALVFGSPAKREGEISSFLGRHPKDRKKIAVLHNRGREAFSRWRVEKDWGETALLLVRIETGRTHQIRVHLSHMGHPVVGDETYGGGKRRARNVRPAPVRDVLLGAQRQMLHAVRLEFAHPVTGAVLSTHAPLPDDFTDLIRRLDSLSQSG